jgi:hypothetical protein
MTSAIVRWAGNAQLSPGGTSRAAAVAFSTTHSPGTVRWEADKGIPYSGAGTAALAGGVRVGRGANRDPPSGRREPRQQGCPVPPFGNRLGPLVPPFLVSVPNRTACVGSGEHSHDRGDTQLGQCIRMRGIIGRQVDREPGLDSRGDQAPVLDRDRVATEDGLMGKGDHLLAGVGGDELVKELAVDLRTVSGKVACLSIRTGGGRACLGAFGRRAEPSMLS